MLWLSKTSEQVIVLSVKPLIIEKYVNWYCKADNMLIDKHFDEHSVIY